MNDLIVSDQMLRLEATHSSITSLVPYLEEVIFLVDDFLIYLNIVFFKTNELKLSKPRDVKGERNHPDI